MERILKKIERINDVRQWWKVKHKLLDIVMIVLFATLANADEWEEIEDFAHANEEFLRGYLELPWGIPPMIQYKESWRQLILSICRQ